MTATLKTLVAFNSTTGTNPHGNLIADSNGNLLGTTVAGGSGHAGTVFEIAKTGSGFASTPTTLVSFTDGGTPSGGLLADASGNLFGTAENGGTSGSGSVFEVTKTGSSYASTPTTLVSFSGSNGSSPVGGLIADANGNLLGTTAKGGANGAGTVFEIAKTAGGFAGTPTTLVSFSPSDANGSSPVGTLFADASGNLFGTASFGGASGDGTVFEIAKTAGGYASTPTLVVSFSGANGANPAGGLIADANGDLFGTTAAGGANGDGTVFEIKKIAGGYASTPTTLVSFNGSDGIGPDGNLIIDANGDLFGTTSGGGVGAAGKVFGTVFELQNTSTGYLDIPTTLATFTGSNGAGPTAGLLADANGDLFGTTFSGGPNAGVSDGTVFEITGSGFATTPTPPPTVTNQILWQDTGGNVAVWDVSGGDMIASAVVADAGPTWQAIGTGDFSSGQTGVLFQNTDGTVAIWEISGANLTGSAVIADPGPSWSAIGTGDFNGDGQSEIVLQDKSGNVAVWQTNGTSLTGSAVVGDAGPSWHAVGTGDFTGDGKSEILFQNTDGTVAVWQTNGTSLTGSAVIADPGPGWNVIGTGDFNGGSQSDILLQNTDGTVAIWETNGTSLTGSAVVGDTGPSWHAIGTDGGADILFQNTNGQTATWQMNGNTIASSAAVTPNPGTTWHAIALT